VAAAKSKTRTEEWSNCRSVKTKTLMKTVILPLLFFGVALSSFAEGTVLLRERDSNLTMNESGECYFELATGLNHWQDSGWVPSTEVIESFQGGAVYRNGQHSVIWANNPNTAQAVDFLGSDGVRLQSTVYGLVLWDPDSGHAAQIASLKDSTGELVAPNEILYPDALNGLSGSIHYRISIAGLEQDVVLDGFSAALDPKAYGMNPETAQLQVLTEFFTTATPQISPVDPQGGETNQLTGDNTISFGASMFGRGRAFLNLPGSEGVHMTRLWSQFGDRTFLVESVRFADIASQLAELPELASAKGLPLPKVIAVKGKSTADLLAATLALAAPMRSAKTADPIRVAQSRRVGKELVLDYVLQGSSGSLTFSSGTTFYVSSLVSLTGVAEFDSCIIKYAPTNSAQIQLNGYTECRTAQWRPAILTARDDDSVGAIISGSTSVPSGYYAYIALNDNASGAFILHDMRIAYAQNALNILTDNGGCQLYNGQILNCSNAVVGSTAMFGLKNVLVNNVISGFAGTSPNSGVRVVLAHPVHGRLREPKVNLGVRPIRDVILQHGPDRPVAVIGAGVLLHRGITAQLVHVQGASFSNELGVGPQCQTVRAIKSNRNAVGQNQGVGQRQTGN